MPAGTQQRKTGTEPGQVSGCRAGGYRELLRVPALFHNQAGMVPEAGTPVGVIPVYQPPAPAIMQAVAGIEVAMHRYRWPITAFRRPCARWPAVHNR